MANLYGKSIKFELFGESHGSAIGGIIDGLKSGIEVDFDFIRKYMLRRKADGILSTPRIEADEVKILSGVFNGYTTGSPLAFLIENNNTKSKDYPSKMDTPRPSHADYPATIKYKGFEDIRGGGHFSGRLTAPLVFAGGLAMQEVNKMGISVSSHIIKMLDLKDRKFNQESLKEDFKILSNKKVKVLDAIEQKIEEIILDAKSQNDSVGAKIECAVDNLPIGLGEPFFESLESRLSQMMFSIPAIKGVEFGLGFEFADRYASQCNDEYFVNDNKIQTKTNNNGGVLGGLSNGMPLIFNLVVKPTPTISKEQNTVSISKMDNAKLTAKGRHDPCIALRVLPVIECATALVIYDLICENNYKVN